MSNATEHEQHKQQGNKELAMQTEREKTNDIDIDMDIERLNKQTKELALKSNKAKNLFQKKDEYVKLIKKQERQFQRMKEIDLKIDRLKRNYTTELKKLKQIKEKIIQNMENSETIMKAENNQ